jgi:hypothetical protein
MFSLWSRELPISSVTSNSSHALTERDRASFPGALEQQSIEREAREDCNRMLHAETHAIAGGTDEFAVIYRIGNGIGIGLGIGVGIVFGARIRKKWILPQSLEGESAAARFLPGKLLIEDVDFGPTCSEQSSGECTGRTSSNDCNGFARSHGRLEFCHISTRRRRYARGTVLSMYGAGQCGP